METYRQMAENFAVLWHHSSLPAYGPLPASDWTQDSYVLAVS